MTDKVKRKYTDNKIGNITKKARVDTEESSIRSKLSKLPGKKPFVAKNNSKKKPLFKKRDFENGNKVIALKQNEKKNWNEFKAQKKELKESRKRQKIKNLYELSVQAKQLYETIKCKATPNKHDLCKQLHDLFKKQNSYEKLVYSHDIARVVQCLLKYAQAEIKKEICDLLLPHISAMAISKYAHFCVKRMLIYGTKVARSNIIKGFYGHVVKLTTHIFSNEIIDTAYNLHASDHERAQMRQEFYSDLYKNDKDLKVERMSDVWKGSPEMKKAVISCTKANLLKCANKQLLDNSLVHVVLLDYLNECSEVDKDEMFQTLIPFVAHLASTKEGTQVAIMCFLHSSTKDRRALLKGIKEHVVKICNAEFGHLFMITIINCTDDTVILGKLILSVIMNSVEEIANNEWGRKVLEWIVAPEDRGFFHPKQVLEINDGLKFSKKDSFIRRNEILAIIESAFASKMIENPSFWLQSGSIGLLTGAILKIINKNLLQKVYDSLVTVICSENWNISLKKEDKEIVIAGIEDPGLHVALKKIIKNDQLDGPSLSKTIVDSLDESVVNIWTNLNRASFILVNILEHTSAEYQNKLKLKINLNNLEKQSHTGSKILLKKLNK